MIEDWTNGGFGIYVHWPFCEAKCPYCDFNSHVSRHIDQGAWRQAYLKEIDRYAKLVPGRVVQSIFFGGGTPSLMDPQTVADVIEAIKGAWPVANDLEVTLEANPGSVEAGRFQEFRQGGISRVSMGIQALNDEDLRRLGRIHTAHEALAAFDIARAHFDRVSFDLIYGRQDQTLVQWESELESALNLAIDHLSLYQLTIEQGTAFGDRYKLGKLRGLPDEDLSADMFSLTQEVTGAAGMSAYEVSNHARDGAESRHNLIYWRYGDYVGIGPGAHGRLTLAGQRSARSAFSNPSRWLGAVDSGEAEYPITFLDATDQASEFLMMGLRLREGVDLDRYERIANAPLKPEALDRLRSLGFIDVVNGRLFVLNQGVMILNTVILELLRD